MGFSISQQWGQLIGVITSAGFVRAAVIMHGQPTVSERKDLSAPQATLMKRMIEGVFGNIHYRGLCRHRRKNYDCR